MSIALEAGGLTAKRALEVKDDRLKRPCDLSPRLRDADRERCPWGGGGGGNELVNPGLGDTFEWTRDRGRGYLVGRVVDGVAGEIVVAALVGVLCCEGSEPGEAVSAGEMAVLTDVTKRCLCGGNCGEYGGGRDEAVSISTLLAVGL